MKQVNTTTITGLDIQSSDWAFNGRFATISLIFNGKVSKRQWYRETFTGLLSDFGGLAVAVFAGLRVLMKFFHDFAKD